ncbi:MAG: S10 family peptidase [Fimbriimonadaceae bacterium]
MPEEKAKDAPTVPQKEPKKLEEEKPVVTEHETDGLHYTATTGRLPIKDEEGEIVAQMFYVAYAKKDAGADRPIMFSFNGGPGSPAIWLHLGALGPKRARMLPDGQMPPPPYKLEDNPAHWLEFADLVFIDPVGTGFSRAKTQEEAKKYWGVKGDIESVGEFIRLYLTRSQRWLSPVYLAGESYGTTRAAGLAGHLIDRGIAFAGVVLVSSILNFQTARFNKGNDLPFVLFLPTYAATAWYHGCLVGDLKDDLGRVVDDMRKFAVGRYATALAQGDNLDAADRAHVLDTLARYTGLSHKFLDQCDLRINIHDFCKEILRTDRRTVGRLDSRVKGIEDYARGHTQRPDHDPSMSMLTPPYLSAFMDYVRRDLGYETDLPYEIFSGIKNPWDWGSAGDGHPDTSEALRAALSKNPYMKVFVANGYYDLATPFFATEYTLSHMGLDPELRGQFHLRYYEAGHMMYVKDECLTQLRADVKEFVQSGPKG